MCYFDKFIYCNRIVTIVLFILYNYNIILSLHCTSLWLIYSLEVCALKQYQLYCHNPPSSSNYYFTGFLNLNLIIFRSHVSDIQYFLGFISVSMISSKFIHVGTRGRISFLIWLNNNTLCLYTTSFFIHLSVGGPLWCFHSWLLGIMLS